MALSFALVAVIVALVLLIRHNRLLAERISVLRQTLNEAIVHDLKNPMTAVMACLSLLRDEEDDKDRRKRMVEIALHACRAQLTLLETLVDSNRLEDGELVLNRRSLDIGALLRESLEDVRAVSETLGVRLEERFSSGLPTRIGVDPDLFPRVIANLLQNALKYTPKGGVITLTASSTGGAFRFAVRDTGRGIARENLGRLFGKYYRVEGADQSSRRGSGLGLYFCRMVIEAHGGTIEADSRNGAGTTITIAIPHDENRSLPQ